MKIPHHVFAEYLQARLQKPLPGWQAQQMMSPLITGTSNPDPRSVVPDAKNAAGLAILQPMPDNSSSICLTVRSQKVHHHKGQISFPGGRAESGETIAETALRETFEEIGIPPHEISVLGELTPLYVPPSRSHLHILVGIAADNIPMVASPDEVDEIVLFPFHEIATNKNLLEWKEYSRDGLSVNAPLWRIHPTADLWGATAMILSELVWLYNELR